MICTHCELVKEKALGEVTRQRLAACHSYQPLGRRIFKAFPEVSSLWGGAVDTAQLAGIVSVGWTEGPGALYSEVWGLCVPHLIRRACSRSQVGPLT